jgi:hypothetical protein
MPQLQEAPPLTIPKSRTSSTFHFFGHKEKKNKGGRVNFFYFNQPSSPPSIFFLFERRKICQALFRYMGLTIYQGGYLYGRNTRVLFPPLFKIPFFHPHAA